MNKKTNITKFCARAAATLAFPLKRLPVALLMMLTTATAWATETTVTYTLDYNSSTRYWLKGTDGSSYNIGSASAIGKTLTATLGNATITITSDANISINSISTHAPSDVDWSREFSSTADCDFTVTTTSGYVKSITVYGIAKRKTSGDAEFVVISRASEAYSNTLHWDHVTYSTSFSVGTEGNQNPGKIVVTYTDVPPVTYYNITYVLNGGTNAAGNPTTYADNAGVASFAAPTRTGYDFGGWYDNASFTGSAVTSIAAGTTGDKTLYAKWTPTTYTITYDLGGGTVASTNPTTYTIESAAITLVNPTRTGYTFAGWTGTGLDAATQTVTIAHGSTGNRTYTATFAPDPAHFSVSGDEYTIHTATGWGVFCDALQDNDTYNRFSDKTVRLGTDISVTRMAGSNGHDFCGTFDGGGYTLDVDISSDADHDYTAPFSYISNVGSAAAAIRNLNVTGTVTATKDWVSGLVGAFWGTLTIEDCTVSASISTSNKHAAGFISREQGTATIRNCRSSVSISGTVSGDGTHAGFIGGSGSGVTTEIEGCLFDGSLLGTATTHCAGFVGYNSGTLTISNSLFDPADVSVGDDNSCTFARNGGTVTVENSYYTAALGTAQGLARLSVTAGDAYTTVAVSPVGDATQTYSVSGITAYAKGITRTVGSDATFYYGQGDAVSLTLGNTASAPLGYQYADYTASGGTLSGSTLTMPDADVTISLDTSHPRSTGQAVSVSYTDATGASHEAQAIALDGYETVTTQYGSQYIDLAAGWYYVGTDIDYTGKCIRPQGAINLILGNGKTMHIGTADNPTDDNGIERGIMDLTIYGQSLDNAAAGTLSYVGTGDGIDVNNYTQHSGNVSISHTSTWLTYGIDCYNATINGGTFNATGGKRGISTTTTGTVTINGGTVNASGTEYGIYAPGGTITLGWTRATDRITASSYGGTLAVATGQALTDGDGNILTGTLAPAAVNGKTLAPYALLTLADDADNTAAINAANGVPATVTLQGRTLYKDGKWNTLCLPFDVTIASSPLAGDNVEAKVFDNTTNLDGEGLLTLKFAAAPATITAGTPFIIKWDNTGVNLENPVFIGVTISSTAAQEVESTDGNVKFVGEYSPFDITADNIHEILYVASGNKIGYSKSARTLKSCRAHFWVKPNSPAQAGARAINIDWGDGEATSITLVNADSENAACGIYTLDGRKLSGQPTEKGVYIVNGKKIVIK